ncbi:unnamed protein product [Owenia fusiformis]|uniref:Uncharacterized protein n=1 Tax=Owenia fusiformis TaxID=6347 RepID=A0A8J1T7G3_OWEFU|nr:unnamed protein product [Owenia fusiformis]
MFKAALFAGLLAVSAGLSLVVMPNKTHFEEGDTISFSCIHLGLRQHEKIRFIKKLSYEKPCRSGGSCIVADGDRMNAPFVNAGRYKIVGDQSSGSTLTIDGLVAEDTGTIGCRIESADEEKVQAFFVYRDIQDIKLVQRLSNGTNLNLKNGDKIQPVAAGEDLDISCITNGSNSDPDFEVYISETDEPVNLVTSSFEPGAQNIMGKKMDGGLNMVNYYRNFTSLGLEKFKMTSTYHKMYLYCAAKIEILDAKKIWVSLDVLFPPENPQCENGTAANYGESNVEITCSIRTNPSSNVTWVFPWGESASGKSSNDNYSISAEYTESTNTLVTSAIIFKAEEDVFDKPFNLTAYNIYGEVFQQAYIVLGGASGAIQIYFSVCLTLSCLMMTIAQFM